MVVEDVSVFIRTLDGLFELSRRREDLAAEADKKYRAQLAKVRAQEAKQSLGHCL